jgi:hypothetical protein
MEELLTDEASNRHKSSVALFLKIKKANMAFCICCKKVDNSAKHFHTRYSSSYILVNVIIVEISSNLHFTPPHQPPSLEHMATSDLDLDLERARSIPPRSS